MRIGRTGGDHYIDTNGTRGRGLPHDFFATVEGADEGEIRNE